MLIVRKFPKIIVGLTKRHHGPHAPREPRLLGPCLKTISCFENRHHVQS